MMILAYLLYSMFNYISYNCDALFLAKPHDSSNCLFLNGRVPLWLKDVDAICHREVQSHCSSSKCHEERGNCRILLEIQDHRATFRECHRAIDDTDWNVVRGKI